MDHPVYLLDFIVSKEKKTLSVFETLLASAEKIGDKSYICQMAIWA